MHHDRDPTKPGQAVQGRGPRTIRQTGFIPAPGAPPGRVSSLLSRSRGSVSSQRQKPTRSSGKSSGLLFEQNACPMWICDAKTSAFLEVNAAASALYGYSRDEFLSTTPENIHPPDDARLRPGTGTWRHLRKNGGVIEVEVSANRIEWDGRPAHLATVRDVSGQAKTEK